MSWNDPCMVCGKPRHSCECEYKPRLKTQEEKQERYRKQKEAEETCAREGHQWTAVITVYCSRCGYDEGY